MNIDNEHEHERSIFFSERKITVHISRIDGFWCNGLILEVGSDFFIIKDRFDGKEHFIFFQELKKPIEKFNEVEK